MEYENKKRDYYAVIRHDLIELIDNKENGNLKILEIGAAYGETLFYLKETAIATEVVGIDLFEDIENKDNYKKLDKFIFGDIQKLELDEYNNYFDIILLPDVLEHLTEPKPVLEKIKNYLKPDGKIIVSMPNFRHFSAIYKVFIKGDFKYEPRGLFDYTHLRFYCKKNIKQLIEAADYNITKSQSSIYYAKSNLRTFNNLSFKLFEEFLSDQYYFVARK
jgi:2-polyprenyl-3-methyl-5-hydroxy-6-metoxy-1,4-benzoquinol methylase